MPAGLRSKCGRPLRGDGPVVRLGEATAPRERRVARHEVSPAGDEGDLAARRDGAARHAQGGDGDLARLDSLIDQGVAGTRY